MSALPCCCVGRKRSAQPLAWLLLLAVGTPSVAWADVAPPRLPPKPTSKPAPPSPSRAKSMTADPMMLAQLSSFLREYHHALQEGNRRFLGEHTQLPLPFAEATYDMEAKAKSRQLASLDEVIAAKDRLRWPDAVLPASAADISRLRRGVQKCGDPKAPEVPDWTGGDPAFHIDGAQVTLTYLNQPCESETHMVTLTFARQGSSFKLLSRTIRMGRR